MKSLLPGHTCQTLFLIQLVQGTDQVNRLPITTSRKRSRCPMSTINPFTFWTPEWGHITIAGLHRQSRRGPLQGLNASHLVNRHSAMSFIGSGGGRMPPARQQMSGHTSADRPQRTPMSAPGERRTVEAGAAFWWTQPFGFHMIVSVRGNIVRTTALIYRQNFS
jgi:hypothetical protein